MSKLHGFIFAKSVEDFIVGLTHKLLSLNVIKFFDFIYNKKKKKKVKR